MLKSNTEAARLLRIRRRAARYDKAVWKVREDSRYYGEYGPYAVKDMAGRRHTGALIAWGLDLDALEKEFADEDVTA